MKITPSVQSYFRNLIRREAAIRHVAQIARGIAKWWLDLTGNILGYLPIPMANLCFLYSVFKIRVPYWSDNDSFPTPDDAAMDFLKTFVFFGLPGLMNLFFMRKRPIIPWIYLSFIALWTAGAVHDRFSVNGRGECVNCEYAGFLGILITWPVFGTIVITYIFIFIFRALDWFLTKIEAWEAEKKKSR